MAALWIATVDVTDDAAYAEYAAIASEVIPAHGGEFIARGGRYVQLEGRERTRNVVARFPDVDSAVAAYNDPRYQDAVIIAKVASDREIVVVELTD